MDKKKELEAILGAIKDAMDKKDDLRVLILTLKLEKLKCELEHAVSA